MCGMDVDVAHRHTQSIGLTKSTSKSEHLTSNNNTHGQPNAFSYFMNLPDAMADYTFHNTHRIIHLNIVVCVLWTMDENRLNSMSISICMSHLHISSYIYASLCRHFCGEYVCVCSLLKLLRFTYSTHTHPVIHSPSRPTDRPNHPTDGCRSELSDDSRLLCEAVWRIKGYICCCC